MYVGVYIYFVRNKILQIDVEKEGRILCGCEKSTQVSTVGIQTFGNLISGQSWLSDSRKIRGNTGSVVTRNTCYEV